MQRIFNWGVALALVSALCGCSSFPPVMDNAMRNDLSGVKQAVEHGEDVNARADDSYMSALWWAVRHKNTEMTGYLLDKGSTLKGVFSYAGDSNLEIVKLMVERGASIDEATPAGTTAFHMACREDKLDIAQYLLNKGANINTTNTGGITPLMDAAALGNMPVVEFLVKHGAKLNIQSAAKDTALHWGVFRDRQNVVQYLVEQGADTELRNIGNKTAFETAQTSEMKQFIASGLQKAVQAKLQAQVNALIAKKDMAGLAALTEQAPGAADFIPDATLRLDLTGPKGMKVRDIRQMLSKGRSEAIVIQQIRGNRAPYKEFTNEEIDMLGKMGVPGNTVAAMMEVTTSVKEEARKRKEQEQLLARQNAAPAQVQSDVPNNQSPTVGDQVTKQVGNEVANRLLRQILPF